MTTTSVWGAAETRFFYELTPERILDAVEAATDLRCTGRVLALNSMENRVYEVEIETDVDVPLPASERFLIAKFYRPGRWSEAQILDEHRFLLDLTEAEIPAVAPRQLSHGGTLAKLPHIDIYYAIFPKIGGRSPDELDDEQLAQTGRLLARLHNVGAVHPATHRLALDPDSYGLNNLRHLIDAGILPEDTRPAYEQAVEEVCRLAMPLFANTHIQRIHGDCHLGNLLQGRQSLFFVDFDDMVMGPCVQDLWLIVPGRDDFAARQRAILLNAYETMRPFDRRQLQLIEPLRALRFIHFSAWIGRRWQDPAFPRAFPHFGTARYWQEQLRDLNEQLHLIREGLCTTPTLLL